MCNEINIMNKVFVRKDAPLTVSCGKIHYCLGMTLDYSIHDKLNITMFLLHWMFSQ